MNSIKFHFKKSTIRNSGCNMKKLIFYEYLFKKMLKSFSTYITGIIAIIPIWGVTIAGVSEGSISESTLSMLAYFTFPIMIIFLAFKVSQVFRDEIENKTLLTIQAKPITRKQMVYQGLMAVNTFSLFLTFFGGFVPFIVASGVAGPSLVGMGALLSLTELLLLLIVSVIALWLSISMGGKAFIGTMIGGFVAGFYVLFGITAFINVAGSKSIKVQNLMHTNGASVTSDANDDHKYTINLPSSMTTEEAQRVYDDFSGVNKQNLATISAWFNPATHWTTMFAATSVAETKNLQNQGINIWDILTSNVKVHMLTDRSTIPSTHTFVIEIEDTKLIPTWYPYLVWLAIAGISLPFIVRSITRKNIA